MTTITIKDKEIEVKGHSGYGTKGNDIVCAAISTLTESTYNYLKITDNKVRSLEGNGEFTIILDKTNKAGKSILKGYIAMLDDLIEQYPRYIERRK